MTIGIYSLWWEQTDKIYIGLSQNCEARFREHILDMQGTRHCNYKIQHHYNTYGIPILNILEECNVSELNNLEIVWMAEFNSIEEGLNLVEGGHSGWGVNASGSKYSKKQILKAFRLLYSSDLMYKEICKITGVSIDVIGQLRLGNIHLWLKDKYPNSYLKMLKRTRGKSMSKYINNPVNIMSPDGLMYLVTEIRKFALQHNLDSSHLASVLNQKRKSHKGWRLP